MSIYNLKSRYSAALQTELACIEQERSLLEQKILKVETPYEFYSSFTETIYGKEFVTQVEKQGHNRSLKILDIGFGRGESALYLMERGHRVTALEPSPLNCSILEKGGAKFKLPVHIVQGVAEDLAELPERGFDLCIFNSSLHHCDQPLLALQSCHTLLRRGGTLLAVNEPLLKFYSTKKRYFKKMETAPLASGHYGGNEHIYTYKEYIRMLKETGFENVEGSLHLRSQFPRETLLYDIQKKIGGECVHSDGKLWYKYGFLLLLKNLLKSPLLHPLFKHLSLVPITFTAVKP